MVRCYTYLKAYFLLIWRTAEKEEKLIIKKRRFWVPALFSVAVLLLSSCGSNETNGNGDKRNSTAKGSPILEDGKFIFAASGEFHPFSYMDGNQMSGFDIDVGNAISDKLGLEPIQKKYKFAGIVEGVKAGKFDAAVASHTINEERKKHVLFSKPYYYSGPQIFTRPGSDIQHADDLKDKEIAVSKGSSYADIAKEHSGQEPKYYDSDVVALEALANGKHDAVVTDFATGAEAMKKKLNITAQERLGQSEQAIAVSKENEQLIKEINDAIDALKKDGTLKQISEKYFDEDITVKQD
ncbi:MULTISPECIES: transporter substrate-binding domain-containing protein [Bacillus]|uniref:transporter substrate-binding domain-containing protein n=1 Tax=Bacillus TaxID=1386 RepID=UPI0007FB2FEA|nr:transporter substrate-binding domain-containing protein [Bacillus safensis]MBU8604562.1 transporter substrate-binding domain-containing protein [Bacillus safensis]MBU8615983.1 transporter substrate-binding domain-containing protein [Bacillus safensis]MBU8627111.1 transporter substrate-binding domain-containing protein [Bacillus safensis]MCY1095150.1 transporter substrate-binding domain-containing protein [Bacillus safensis]MCY7523956.1 transporter substrate-binding domain-containing protein